MLLTLRDGVAPAWRVDKIAVVGPGIVGMPMAALLARAALGSSGAPSPTTLVVQRRSARSGWKVDAINAGRSPIGGLEPDLDRIIAEAVAAGALSATHDYAGLADADVILVCVQTDKQGMEPDYGPLMDALTEIATALRDKPADTMPLIIFESTLAPSSLATVVREHFARSGLEEGRDLLLGNSPNRVMPGRLVERVVTSDKIVGGLQPVTADLIAQLYTRVVTGGTLHRTNSMTAEVVKTLENAYRDVRIAYSTEVARYCDACDIDFYGVRQQANEQLAQTDAASIDPNAVPSGGLLIPTVGVGGHCLPKDGVLLWWRKLASGADASRSVILEARRINDESPAEMLRLAERSFGPLAGRAVSLLGTAYRFNSEDTRNSPTLTLAGLLLERGCSAVLHDPYVSPDDQNLVAFQLDGYFTRDVGQAVAEAEYLFMCTAHRLYLDARDDILRSAPRLRGVVDGCNLYRAADIERTGARYVGIGRGTRAPDPALVDAVVAGFHAVERGLANELQALIDFLNERYAGDAFNRVAFRDVQRLAGTCVTGCLIADPAPVEAGIDYDGFSSRLVNCSIAASPSSSRQELPSTGRSVNG